MVRHELQAQGTASGYIQPYSPEFLPDALVFTDMSDGRIVVYVRWSHG